MTSREGKNRFQMRTERDAERQNLLEIGFQLEIAIGLNCI